MREALANYMIDWLRFLKEEKGLPVFDISPCTMREKTGPGGPGTGMVRACSIITSTGPTNM
jgi:hypothetical protein